jgi:hypothetical protein
VGHVRVRVAIPRPHSTLHSDSADHVLHWHLECQSQCVLGG